MRFFKKILIPLMFSGHLYAQNLVMNPSFEEYNELQDNIDYIFSKKKFCVDCFFAKHWQLPSWVGVDYYHCDNKNPPFSSPNNTFGFHPAKDGCAYIGFVPLNWDGVAQHLTGTLEHPLEKEKKYKVSFYIQHAGTASQFGCSKIGINFHSTLFPLKYDPPLYTELFGPEDTFHIVATNDNFIFNDTAWTEIGGVYVAKGGEKYFTIGVFDLEKMLDAKKMLETVRYQGDPKKREKLMRSAKYQQLIKMKYEFDPVWHMPEGDPYYFIDMVSVTPLE